MGRAGCDGELLRNGCRGGSTTQSGLWNYAHESEYAQTTQAARPNGHHTGVGSLCIGVCQATAGHHGPTLFIAACTFGSIFDPATLRILVNKFW